MDVREHRDLKVPKRLKRENESALGDRNQGTEESPEQPTPGSQLSFCLNLRSLKLIMSCFVQIL